MTEYAGTIHVPHTPHGSALSPGGPTPSQPPGGNPSHGKGRSKFFRGMSRETAAWYRSMSKRTGLSIWEVQRVKMLSYGIPVYPSEFDLSKDSAMNAIYRITAKLPWLKVVFVAPGGYVVRQPYLDQLKRYMEQE